jgi:hypothetical protein
LSAAIGWLIVHQGCNTAASQNANIYMAYVMMLWQTLMLAIRNIAGINATDVAKRYSVTGFIFLT